MSEIRIPVVIEAADPMTEIFVIDSSFRLAIDQNYEPVKGIGKITTALNPGLYKAKFKNSINLEEIPFSLESTPLKIKGNPLPLNSALPLEDSVLAETLSHEIRQTVGVGSQLFIFIQGSDIQKIRPTGLTVHDKQGNLIFDLDVVCQASSSNCLGGNFELDPGYYRMRIKTGACFFELGLVTCMQWQTQIFLTLGYYPELIDDERLQADLANASILMSRVGMGFDSQRPDWRATEIARMGLRFGRKIVNRDVIQQLLYEKFGNPMLGIYAAHLLLMAKEIDWPLLEEVIGNLDALVGPHPDVMALKFAQADKSPSGLVFREPPMLKASWDLLVKATVFQPEMIPSGSLSALVAENIWDSAPWLIWKWLPSEPVVYVEHLFSRLRFSDEVETRLVQGGDNRAEKAILDWLIMHNAKSVNPQSVYWRKKIAINSKTDLKIFLNQVSVKEIAQELSLPVVLVKEKLEVIRQRLGPSKRPITVPDDPQKGRWGGLPESNGRKLTAEVAQENPRSSWYDIELMVSSIDPEKPLVEMVTFYLHDSFPEDIVSIRPNKKGVAVLELEGWGAFTVGAVTDCGLTELELDMETDTVYVKAPKAFRDM